MKVINLLQAGIFLLFGSWFLWRNRRELNRWAIARHIIFITLVFAGSLSFMNGGVIVRWVFGREIYKGDPKEFLAGLVFLGAPLLFFALAAIALGKDRVRHFKLYAKTFGFKEPRPPAENQ